MANSIKIELNTGNGLYLRQDKMLGDYKLAVLYDPDHQDLIHREPDGSDIGAMWVGNLKGEKGDSGGSSYDGYTVTGGKGYNISNDETIEKFLDINRAVVNLIFTIGLYKPLSRSATSVSYTSTVKSVSDMCNEIDAPLYYGGLKGRTSYKPAVGELIQLVTNPTFRITTNASGVQTATESINRVFNTSDPDKPQEVKAMFVITSITYPRDIDPNASNYWVSKMTLQCIYSEVPEYVVGNSYSGTDTF